MSVSSTADREGFPVVSHLVHFKPVKEHWQEAARRKGFTALCRARDRQNLVLRCRTCGGLSLVRTGVVRDFTPVCRHCIRIRAESEAAAIGARLLEPDAADRKYATYELPCGHIVRRQYRLVMRAARGEISIGCETCREARYAGQAQTFGWLLIGSHPDKKPGYRLYRHACGHAQEISVGNMSWGDCTCAGCGSGWSTKPSAIYVFRIELQGLPVVKLGYSCRPQKRLRHQLGLRPETPSEVLRVIRTPTGNRAVAEESAAHRYLIRNHPEWVVPHSAYGDAISTRSEIYRPAALPVIHQLLDNIEARLTQEGDADEAEDV